MLRCNAMATKAVMQDNTSYPDNTFIKKSSGQKVPSTRSSYPPSLNGSQHDTNSDTLLPSSIRKVNIINRDIEQDSKTQNTTPSPMRKSRRSVFEAPSKIRSSSESDLSPHPEFRNGLRVQKKAYERGHDETGSEFSYSLNNRRFSNAYVERLKQFYQYENIFQSYYFPPVWSVRNSPEKNNMQSGQSGIPRSLERLPSFRYENNKGGDSHTAMNGHFRMPELPVIGNTNSKRTVTPANNQHSSVTITVTSPSGKTWAADDTPLDKNITGKSKLRKYLHQTDKNNNKNRNKNQGNNTKIQLEKIVVPSNNFSKNKSHSDSKNPSSSKSDVFATPSQSQKTGQLSHSKDTTCLPMQTNPSFSVPPPVPMLVTPLIGTQTSPINSPKRDPNISNTETSSNSPVDTQSILEAVQRLGLSRRPSNAARSGGVNSNKYRQQQRRKARLNRATLETDSKEVAMKLSLPCKAGCCYCVYASLLGPVKIYMSRGERPKKEPSLLGIKDGRGRPGIPVSRKEDITGLVYDAHNHSFHPPPPPSLLSPGRRSLNSNVSKSGSGPYNGTAKKNTKFPQEKATVNRPV